MDRAQDPGEDAGVGKRSANAEWQSGKGESRGADEAHAEEATEQNVEVCRQGETGEPDSAQSAAQASCRPTLEADGVAKRRKRGSIEVECEI